MNELHIDKTHWKKYKFDEVCRQVNEATKDPQAEGLDHVIGLEHIEPNNLHITQWDTLEKETTFTRKFRKGQVLFGRRRAYQRKVAYAEFDGICSGDILVFEAIKDVLLPELLPFLIQSEGFFQKALATSAGSLSPRTKFKELADYEFLLPPKAEQKRLAELLWAADEVVEKEKREREKLQSYYFALQTNIFQNNTNCTKRLCDIANITMGQSPVGSSYNENNEGVPFLQGNSEFTDKYPVAIKYTTAPTKMANAGDILMSVRAPVGAINIADRSYCIGRGLCAISAKSGNNDYLRFLLQSKIAELDRISTGSTFKAINSNDLRNLEVPSEEQDVSLLLKCEKAITDLNGCIQRSKQIKQELINKIY